MSGDVFGNAHAAVAGDPAGRRLRPPRHLHRSRSRPGASLAERQRLFDLPRSSWQDYDAALISRRRRRVLAPRQVDPAQPRDAARCSTSPAERATPNEVIRAILKARVDLLFFGGIGTFVRGADEADERVGDRANDAIRITADELRARVVGEGANLGMTQRGRVAYGLKGGRCNSDAIDNSAGVNTSDVEVNIKIALGRAVRAGRLDMKRRDACSMAMTDEVAELVLRNNYRQTLAISLVAAAAASSISASSAA